MADFRLPRLQAQTPLTDGKGSVTSTFQRYWQSVVEQIERAINLIVELTGIQDQFQQALQEARDAADAARDAADEAKQQTEATKREAALQGSYIEPASVLTADPTTITIAAHTRRYADGTSAPVNGGSISAGGAGETDYIFYDDPTRTGGAVTYQVSTDPPVQTGDRHVVGAIVIPDTGTADGGEGPRRPGYVEAKIRDANQE